MANNEPRTLLASAAARRTPRTLVANDILPSTWRVNLVHADTDSITYSVAAQLVAA